MAKHYNNVLLFTCDNRSVFGFGSELQKCACIVGQGGCEQCQHNIVKSKRSVCDKRLTPSLPIEPIVKQTKPISFINDMISLVHSRRRLVIDLLEPLKSYEVRAFKFKNTMLQSVDCVERPIPTSIRHCFSV